MEENDKLHLLIEAYFDGRLTAREEEALYRHLLKIRPATPEIEEALAVMAYARMESPKAGQSSSKPYRKGKRWLRISQVAASVLLAVTAGMGLISLLNGPAHTDSECLAYVNGVEVRNQERIRALIASQLSEMGDASQDVAAEVNSDLDDIREALKFEEL